MATIQYMKEMFNDRINTMQYFQGKDKEDKKTAEPYENLNKSAVIQESRCFNESQIQDRKCRQILTKLIYLMNQGEEFNQVEAQSLFFGITKLFQSNNADLRRMIYLMIREFRDENCQYVVISCLTKDITSKNDLFRMNALRTIGLVLEQSNLVQLDRYLKNSILDKSQGISSAALLAGLHIFRISPEFIRKWSNEVSERLNSKYPQNTFHALVLLHEIKSNDRITFTKILVQLTKETLVPMANMQVIRFIREIIGEVDQMYEKMFIEYLLRQIHKSQEIVIFEACKALCEIKSLSNKDLQPMIQVLNVFLVSTNTMNKFVALKIINQLIQNPIRRSLLTGTSAIESIITDSKKSLTSLAVSILLKVCQESNIDKLLSQIYEYLGEMTDEFRIDVLRSVKALVLNNPKKWKPYIQFLQQTFKCEGSVEFKKYSVEIIEYIISEIPEAREQAILTLSEYIEDCQHSQIILYILSIINRETAKKHSPPKIIRIINNRLHLENAEIRAAAVGVMNKFYQYYPDQREKVKILLSSIKQDPDEEVRNRIEMADAESQELQNLTLYELDAIEQYIYSTQFGQEIDTLNMDKILEFAELNKNKIKHSEQPTNLVEQEIMQPHIEQHDTTVSTYRKLFQEHQTFKEYGPLRCSSSSIALTDNKCEYLVSLVKHFFDNHIILEYRVKNALENQILQDVSVDLTIKNPNLQHDCTLPAKSIESNCASNIFVGLQFNPKIKLVSSTIQTVLTFTVLENATTYQDDYAIDDFVVTISDFFVQDPLDNKFQQSWESLNVQELSSTYQLDYKNTDIAVKELIKHFGLVICEQSDIIQPTNKFHTLLLTGMYLSNIRLLIICQIGFQANLGCIVKIKCKSQDSILNENVIESLN